MRVALVHGTMDRASSFAKVLRILAADADGIDAVAHDRPGYASRVDERPAGTVGEAVDDLLTLVGAHEPIVVVGHSFGGHLAALAATRRPDVVRAIGIFETPYPWLPFWPPDTSGGKAVAAAATEGPEAAAETFMRSLVGSQVWERLPPSTKHARRAEGRALVADLLAIRRAPYELAAIPVPALVGRGERAAAHQRAGTDHAHATIPGAELHVIDGATHGCHRSHPEAFAAFVRRAVQLAGDAARATSAATSATTEGQART